MSTSVMLAEVLQAKGSPLEEEEIWALLYLGTECLLEDLHKESSSTVICPWSVLLSAEGTLSFRDNVPQVDIAPFMAPEKFCGHSKSKHYGRTKMLMYSLGMTLYWSADYQVPPNQPLQLSDQLHTLLLTLCEDVAQKRPSPESVLEAWEAHQQQSPTQGPANVFIQRLAQGTLGSIREREEGVPEDNVPIPLKRSDAVRKRLHEKVVKSSALPSPLNLHQGSIPQAQQPWDLNHSGSKVQSSYKLLINRSASAMDGIASRSQKSSSQKLAGLGSSFICSLADPAPSRYVSERQKKFSGPEFIVLSSEPPVALQLPGSIMTKNGKSFLSQRDVNVVLLNGQCLEVKCDIKSKAGVVFEKVAAYAGLPEPFYFSLAYMRGKEFFFLDDDTKLYKVAPEGWSDQPKKKASIINFTLFLRIKFFVSDFRIIQHDLTRHQFYLQLRKDLLEERLHCHDELTLQLGAFALRAEMGNYVPETRYRVKDYIPASQIEKMGLAHIQQELGSLHQLTQFLLEEQAELEFLKVTRQLPEYGVVFHQVFQEKRMVKRSLMLGICAQGIMVYEIRNNTRIASQQFQWRDTERISAHKKKFMIESSISGKKHTFLTDSVKTCKYLLDLCSAQHKFNAQMNSQHLLQAPTEDSRFTEAARSNSAYDSQRDNFTLIQRLSRSENALYGTHQERMSARAASKSCDDNSTEASTENGEKSNPTPSSPGNPRKSSFTKLEREIICVTLKRDPRNGFGFVIIGGENVGKLDLGIFIASIIPGGPADRAGHMKPGGRLISVNNISLEGVPFNTAVKIIQNSSDEVELIISQPKDSSEVLAEEKHLPSPVSSTLGCELCRANCERPISEACQATPATEEEYSTDSELKMILTRNSTPKLVPRISACSVGSLEPQDGISSSRLHEETFVKSVITHESADEDREIKKGDCLLEVDGISLLGMKQKRSGQVLAREHCVPAEPGPGDSESEKEHMSPSLARACPKRCFFLTDENTFEVRLRKNSGGLGFSFMQMETDACKDLGRDIIRIKRLFPGQPAKENGEIDIGDILLAVNGKPIQGLLYQEVLHLLRGAPPEVTLRFCRPPQGILPEIDQSVLTPLLSPVKEFVPSLVASSSGSDLTATEKEGSFLAADSPRAACDPEPVNDEPSLRGERVAESPPVLPLTRCSYKHLWKVYQEVITTDTFLSLEEEAIRQRDRKFRVSPGLHAKVEQEGEAACTASNSWKCLNRGMCSLFDDQPTEDCHEIISPAQVDEEYLTISSASITSLLHGGKPEAGTVPEPRGRGLSPPAVLDGELYTSESEWEDLEDGEEPQNTREMKICVTLTRSANKGYGFTVVVNKMDNTLYVAEILGEPALSNGQLRRGDRLLMVNGTDALALSAEETLALLYSSPRDLSLVVGRTTMEVFTSFPPEEIPEIILTKGDCGQLEEISEPVPDPMAFETVRAEFSSGPEPSPRPHLSRPSPAHRSPRSEPSPSPHRSRSTPAVGRERRRSGDSVRSVRSTASRHCQASYLPPSYHCQWEGAPTDFSASEPRPSTSQAWFPPPVHGEGSQLGSDEGDVESLGDYQSESWSEPSPADDVVPATGSPYEDLQIYSDQMARMAQALEMDISSVAPQTKEQAPQEDLRGQPSVPRFPHA
ncbi:FERM and PDZ domain-containing protein 2 [Eublepharis macularius]|uniref:FERM and PDZ domain-containing protein 2 n=1 Tax=Eublepharis macularius TaxID=481883 RepID=A0AA97JL78_EUBMA|nr:FERM and PDZ domain-containing protein 2 [Eublepharis macularius]